MVTSYHSTVKKGIILLGNEWIRKGKVKKIFTGEERPLSLVNHQTKYVMNYKPDVYFILCNNKKLIFEILDSEEKKQDKIIADVIRSFLVENIEAMQFIYYGSDKDEKRIMEALVVISKCLVYKGVKIKDIPFDKSGTILVKKKDATTPEKVKKILLKKLS
jgi:hypothetical protein